MGINGRQDGAPGHTGGNRRRVSRRRHCRSGYTNAALLLAMAVLLLIAVLSLVDSGELDFAALFAKPVPAADKSAKGGKTGKVKPPLVIPPAPRSTAAAGLTTNRFALAVEERADRELRQALANMDSRAAADLLSELDTPTVVELLIGQRERDLARILEAADPAYAAQWVGALKSEVELRRDERQRQLQAAAEVEAEPEAVSPTEEGTPTDVPAEAGAGEDGATGGVPPVAGAESGAGAVAEPPVPNPTGDVAGETAEVPVENGSSATGAAEPLPTGVNIA